ncbi:galactose-6-phosphate isomerase subunit LacA [Enterococcus sp. BWB1-3]|uniref:galactose-6-phosphate isomerase subunit LacA n=1 Tax=unclassified Enterococcus TaxID=2608891 RepID=UPI001923E380|nr:MULTISPECIES: galactose-6-phosphate isomerase subunit LacA [unclassified Enterococcus]MBL1227779.1 galactose-6-phosphate isomerase subunit LacA [Enterococcus sp. BWB1-3]MCB5952032.1 galactose-6-phosphate isomerase subunit LacA [Enterococcus sp. BWT-B8]MCB5954558.1 galactose-6-phosphate isomerase subunit LacA [Enterococcus sp. CWB-B31]
MQVILGADRDGQQMKHMILTYLQEKGFDVLDTTADDSVDFVESTERVVEKIREQEDAFGILFDRYGAGSFIAATKHNGIIAAEVSDERSAYMTREHNNSRIITIGSGIVGEDLARNIVYAFLTSHYEGGRHQIRVDMLNEMF